MLRYALLPALLGALRCRCFIDISLPLLLYFAPPAALLPLLLMPRYMPCLCHYEAGCRATLRYAMLYVHAATR